LSIDTTSLRTDIGYLNYPEPVAFEPASTARDKSQPGTLRVAIVHYWLVSMRGGEKVIEELCQMFPQAEDTADLYVVPAEDPGRQAALYQDAAIDALCARTVRSA
jgi:hypothetical protein